MTVTSLDEVPSGTDLFVRTENSPQPTRLRWEDNQLTKGGRVLDPWFIAGYLAEGGVSIADLRPPQVGEWFHLFGRDQYQFLVGENKTTEGQRVAVLVMFRDQSLYDVREVGHHAIHNEYIRMAQAPEWSSPPLLNMAYSYLQVRRERDTYAQRLRNNAEPARQARDALDYLRVAHDYMNTVQTRLERIRDAG